jgi:hypothetical protein
MTDFYKPEDGDVVKILPILKKDGTFCSFIKTGFVYLAPDGKLIYDQANYLRRIRQNEYVKKSNKIPNIGERFFFFVSINEEFKFMQTGKKLTDIIKEGLYQGQSMGSLLTGNGHLKISKKHVQTGVNSAQFPCFDESKIVEKKWNSPNILTQTEAVEWTMQNQPFYLEDFLKKNGIFVNLKILNEYYDNAFSDLIADEREKKLGELGI